MDIKTKIVSYQIRPKTFQFQFYSTPLPSVLLPSVLNEKNILILHSINNNFSKIRLHICKILFNTIFSLVCKNIRLKEVHPCLFGPPSQKNVLLSIKSPQSSSGEYKDMRLIPQVLSMIESDLLTKIVYQIDRLLQLSNRHPI